MKPTYHYYRVQVACFNCTDHVLGNPDNYSEATMQLIARYPHRLIFNTYEGDGKKSCTVCGTRAHGSRYSLDTERR